MAAPSKYIKFSFPISAYHPDALRSGYTERELRQEYSRLRDVAQKRLKRLQKSEFKNTQTVRYNVGRFKPLKDISGAGELVHLLGDLARFLTASRGSVTGMREAQRKSIETLHESGLTAINEQNYQHTMEVLEYIKSFKEYDPSELVRLMNAAQAEGVPLKTIMDHLDYYYDFWIQNHQLADPPEDWDE